MGILDQRASRHLRRYNESCVHYNLIADGVYRARREIGDPLSDEFLSFIIAGLIGFDMRRTMGRSNPYLKGSEFRDALSSSLGLARKHLCERPLGNLITTDLGERCTAIRQAYTCLAEPRAVARKHFHVGATKALHWLFPDLFLMLDRNAAAAFRQRLHVSFHQGTQPGYSAENYVECLKKAQDEIKRFGPDKFRTLEPDTHIARTFDKIAFVVGENAISSARPQ